MSKLSVTLRNAQRYKPLENGAQVNTHLQGGCHGLLLQRPERRYSPILLEGGGQHIHGGDLLVSPPPLVSVAHILQYSFLGTLCPCLSSTAPGQHCLPTIYKVRCLPERCSKSGAGPRWDWLSAGRLSMSRQLQACRKLSAGNEGSETDNTACCSPCRRLHLGLLSWDYLQHVAG